VVTSNVEEKLGDRPVNRGEQLLEIADPSKQWELEVLMPEKRMGHLAKARSETGGKLPVTFFLATNPADQMEGKVEMDELSAEVRGDSGNTVLVRVSFDQDALRKVIANPKIGAGATAKIHCGKRAIGYVWFHDVVDFIRSKILFRIF
jgi:HlyD family secretion protein